MIMLFTLLVVLVSTIEATPPPHRNIISLPLVPHHVQQQRRRRLQIDEKEEEMFLRNKGSGGRDDRKRRRRRGNRYLHEEDEDEESHGPNQKMQIAHLFQGYGTHYADLWCGQPTPQRQTVIVDTGSGVSAFPCVGCDPEQCGVPKYHLDPLFDPNLSTSFHKLTCHECDRGSCSSNSECHIGMSYQEGSSWSAFEVVDNCYVGGLHDEALSKDNRGKDDVDPFHAPAFTFPLTFGCQTRLTGLFKTQLADGIMGMDHATSAFWYQASQKLGLSHQFSLCFSRSPTASREGTNAGAMTIGGTDPRLHGSEMVYSTVGGGSGFYDVTIRQIYLRQGGGESAAYDAQAKVVPILSGEISGIVDSGTTDTYFSRSMKSKFDEAFRAMVGEAYSHDDVALSESELQSRPTILIQLAGVTSMNENLGAQVVGLAGDLDPDHPFDVILAVPASHYYEYDEESSTYTARFYVDEGGGNVIGANSMMGHDVFFDVDNNRIGWSESNCDYPALAQPFIDSGHLVPSESSRQQEPDESQVPPAEDGTTDTSGEAEGDVNDSSSKAHDTDTPSDDIKKVPGNTCSATCHFGIVASVLIAGVMVVLLLVRRRGSGGKRYRMARNAELELGEMTSADSVDADDFHVQYRDRPSNGGSHHDADEQETGILS